MTAQQKKMVGAIFLLVVFSLNIIAGFACSIGVNMGYNTKHHQQDNHSHKIDHQHKPSHSHNEIAREQLTGGKFTSSTDDCCANEVNGFAQLAKSVPQNNFQLLAPLFFTNTFAFFILYAADNSSPNLTRFQFVRRSCSTYDTDIRIAIQSFQI